ncbi:thioesterase family protein [Oceanibaculum pacificum]|uniref:Thioesterase-like protein n=1 Tax=Oceanibaculum pacificum TaxID=580166 RepID=A0A154WF70_9PROT|nr:thioesterase family protein [Oceanibaculum pacificum]KZD12171.1 hypothetical protein AUP43_17165 [Oceanibaculum pacificum]
MTPPHIASTHRGAVLPDWIDSNGHMNLAYYLVAFDHAIDVFTDSIGMDRAYRDAHGSTIFVVETHLTYARELVEGDGFRIETRVLGVEGRKLRLFNVMYCGDEADTVATNELMILHVDMRTRRSAPFPAPILARLIEWEARQAALPPPPEAGRAIGLQNRTKTL